MRFANTLFGAVLLMLIATTPAVAQLSISISTMPAFRLITDPTASQTVTIISSWPPFYGHANVCVGVGAPLYGTATNTDTIPAANVWVQLEAGGWASVVSGAISCGIANVTQVKSAIDTSKGSRTDAFSFRIQGYPKTLAPDTYTGTISFYALLY